MSEVCRFAGIIISIYGADHNPPHFHARYAEFQIRIAISDLTVLRGRFPSSQFDVLLEWAEHHRNDLMDAWIEAQRGRKPKKINP